MRDIKEVLAAREEGVADIIVWVENNRVPPDPTVTFTSEQCDLVIENNTTLEEFHRKIERFARFAGLPMRGEANSVFAVVHCNYGDQGVDFLGVFASKKLAEEFIARREPREDERQWWDVLETPLEGVAGRPSPKTGGNILDRTAPSAN